MSNIVNSLSETQAALVTAGIAAGATLLVAGFGALAAYLASKRQQRRVTYSEAVKAATAWTELLYRVRRRQVGQEAAIVELFHKAQEDLNYYIAWVGAESKYMARSYRRLVRAIKAATEAQIRAAWADEVRPIPGDALQGDVHPNVDQNVSGFLEDVRSHLSPWPWRKIAVVWRNRKDD